LPSLSCFLSSYSLPCPSMNQGSSVPRLLLSSTQV
jgi:hypothetical protein